jgi:hypothetical protein
MVTVELSDRQADHLLWRLADHIHTWSIDDDALLNAFAKLYDAYNAQALIVVSSDRIEATVAKCRAQERRNEAPLQMTRSEYDAFRSERQAEGAHIDPENCDRFWMWAATLDPYGVLGIDADDEYCTVGREYFVSRPGAKDWVHIGDLSDEAREKIWPRNKDDDACLERLRALMVEIGSATYEQPMST